MAAIWYLHLQLYIFACWIRAALTTTTLQSENHQIIAEEHDEVIRTKQWAENGERQSGDNSQWVSYSILTSPVSCVVNIKLLTTEAVKISY